MDQMGKKIRTWFMFLGLIYLISWLFKGVFISVYMVPSGSMAPTIYNGDYVVVGKFPWRIRTPEFYPLLNIPFPVASARGPASIKRGDVVVFNSPIQDAIHPSLRMTFIKRITGLPGDTLWVRDGVVLDPREVWIVDDEFEKIVVPKKGLTVSGTDSLSEMWITAIRRDNTEKVLVSDRTLIINNTEIDSYNFKQNFYFVTGDDVQNTSDSRHWGFVPEDHIIGKPLLVIWSSQTDRNLRTID